MTLFIHYPTQNDHFGPKIEKQRRMTFEDVQYSGPKWVCAKLLDMVFHCREDANTFKNIFDHFEGQKHNF